MGPNWATIYTKMILELVNRMEGKEAQILAPQIFFAMRGPHRSLSSPPRCVYGDEASPDVILGSLSPQAEETSAAGPLTDRIA